MTLYSFDPIFFLICPLTDFLFEKYPSAQTLGYNGLLYDVPFLALVRANYAEYKQWQLPYVSPMYAGLKNFCPTFSAASTSSSM